ncbi:ABC transporter ATP-binding protein [Mobiluncus mulieris]|uniref:ABC transporter ATP-binding protein n=1 Tax=Mobiluncus mulieris TaxID=2052 RepID=UPI0021E31779|nr:ABC transporter ATP-binding protein [Mobiluncus mulieris]MCV0012212.1 ABC transporter ATP-binding protein [Mobiluncus mulieris]
MAVTTNDETLGTPKTSGALQLIDLVKTFGAGDARVTAVDRVNLDIKPGEFITLLGPSGCGKTTTLRMIAGFENATSGKVMLDGEDMVKLPPNKRPMSMVFQSYALFPHLSVRQNVQYGLKLKKMPKQQMDNDVDVALTAMNLTMMADRAPNQLSGGQQQRVALARAMVMKPKVMLFDEPLSNLDAKLRVKMRTEIRRLQRRLGITSIYVTHDQSEAMSLSDRIVVMNAGRIEQIATPEEIYRRPASVFVADFVGRANFVSAEILEKPAVQDGDDTGKGVLVSVKALNQEVRVHAHPSALDAQHVTLLIRPESIRLKRPEGDSSPLVGTVQAAVFYGETVEYEVDTAYGTVVCVEADPDEDKIFQEGDKVAVSFETERAWLLRGEDGS